MNGAHKTIDFDVRIPSAPDGRTPDQWKEIRSKLAEELERRVTEFIRGIRSVAVETSSGPLDVELIWGGTPEHHKAKIQKATETKTVRWMGRFDRIAVMLRES